MQPTLWSKVFKHQLELGHSEEAYNAMIANPDASRSVSLIPHLTFCSTQSPVSSSLIHPCVVDVTLVLPMLVHQHIVVVITEWVCVVVARTVCVSSSSCCSCCNEWVCCSRKDCLRQFLVVLCERADLQTLVQLPYKDRHVDLEEEVSKLHLSQVLMSTCLFLSSVTSLCIIKLCKEVCIISPAHCNSLPSSKHYLSRSAGRHDAALCFSQGHLIQVQGTISLRKRALKETHL